jgi:hypothetical protein
MTRPHPGEIPALGHWDTPRPLPPEAPKYIHGAIDFVGAVGDPFVFPVHGIAYGFVIMRPRDSTQGWTWKLQHGNIVLPWSGYCEDVYGGIILLYDDNSHIHLFCHQFFDQIFDKGIFPKDFWEYEEEPDNVDFPMRIFHTFAKPLEVQEGYRAGYVGDMGTSKGPHLHWEIHRGWGFSPATQRLDPERWLLG